MPKTCKLLSKWQNFSKSGHTGCDHGKKALLLLPYFWRFLAFLKDSMVLARDLDSRLSNREVEYIRRWEQSDRDYLVIRDHPWHSPYPSGLFGIRRKIDEFEKHFNNYIPSTELVWGTDQDILEKYMSDKNLDDVLYFGYDKLESLKFCSSTTSLF